MKLASAMIVFLTAGIISLIAAYMSVIGMGALFAAGGFTVVLMMSSLEFGKLVASGWLKVNWNNPNVNRIHKFYLTSAVGVLMLITSIGIYGFLSAGHLEQKAPLAGLEVQSQQLEVKIAQNISENERLERRLNQIDQNIAVFLNNDQASRGLSASRSLKAERDRLQKQVDDNNNEINELNEQLIPLKMQTSEVEAKLGPVKYVAALFGWTETESAVRFVILVLMFAFDPLAVVLLLSAMITINEWYKERAPKLVRRDPEEDDFIELEDDFFTDFEEIDAEIEPFEFEAEEVEPEVEERTDYNREYRDQEDQEPQTNLLRELEVKTKEDRKGPDNGWLD